MPAYWVARAKINDPVEYKKYTDRVPTIIRKHGGKVLARGGRYEILEGPKKFHRFIVIEFPTLELGVACFNSPEYRNAAAFRRDVDQSLQRQHHRCLVQHRLGGTLWHIALQWSHFGRAGETADGIDPAVDSAQILG